MTENPENREENRESEGGRDAVNEYKNLILEDYAKYKNGKYGNILGLSPVSVWSTAIFFCILLALIIVFLSVSSYTRTASARGTIEPVGGLITINSPRAGVITSVAAKNGDQVLAGRRILGIKSDASLEDGGTLGEELLSTANNRLTAITLEHSANDRILSHKAATISEQRRGIEKRKSGLLNEMDLVRSRLSIDQQSLEAMAKLAEKGLVSRIRFREYEKEVLNGHQALQRLARELDELEVQEAQIPIQLRSVQSERQKQRAVLRAQTAEHDGTAVQHRANAEGAVSTSIPGRIEGLVAKPGMSVTAGQAVASIVPDGAPLQAVLWVSSKSIGFVKAGTPIRLMLDAYPYEHFGFVNGTIVEIAKVPTPSKDVPIIVDPPEAMFRVTARIKIRQIDAYGKKWDIQAGSAVSADIVLESRTFLQWLYEPVSAIQRAIN